MSKYKAKTIGFGLPDDEKAIGMHCFTVNKESNCIAIYEDYGIFSDHQFKGKFDLKEWSKISGIVKNALNKVLKEKELKLGNFKEPITKIDRMLGMEVALLVAAYEQAQDSGEKARILDNWSNLRSEDRWWLYLQIQRQGDKLGGWRKAVYVALS